MTCRPYVLLCAAGLCVSPGWPAEDVPEPLRKMDEYRRALRTGKLSGFEEIWFVGGDGGIRHNSGYIGLAFANQDRLRTVRGDDEGVALRDDRGGPAPGRSAQRALQILLSAGRMWRHEEGAEQADVFDPEAPPTLVYDARLLGLTGAPLVGQRSEWRRLWESWSDRSCRYQEGNEHGLCVVTCEREDGWSLQWWIDPERGWNPVRARIVRADGTWEESRSTLQQFDGVWFPNQVQFFRSTWKEGAAPWHVVRIYSAEFNRPEHPHRLMPSDIGITKGMVLVLHDRNQAPVHGELALFDGLDPVPMSRYLDASTAEYSALVEGLGSRPHSRAAALIDPNELPRRLQRVQEVESEWEAYTRRFIEKYQLDAEQSEKAWQILKTCQGHAHGYLTRRRAEFERLEKEISGLAGLSGTERLARAAAINELAGKLARPLEEIFERQLKPRLETLPTRKQRAAAEGTPDTQPGGP